MKKRTSFTFKFTKDMLENIIRQHIIDAHESEDADFKSVDSFDDEIYEWNSTDDKEFLIVDLYADLPIRKPKQK